MSRLLQQSVPNRLLASLTALTFVAALAGCSNDDDAPELDETSDASDPATTEYIPASADGPAQNVPEPKLPAVATENTEEGAEATLKYFWEAIDYARLTGDTQNLELISSDECDFCASFLEDWNATYKAGQWAVTHGNIQTEVSRIWVGEDDHSSSPNADIWFNVSDSAIDLYNDNGQIDGANQEGTESSDWFAILLYDATAQRWEIDWVGLEELVEWENE